MPGGPSPVTSVPAASAISAITPTPTTATISVPSMPANGPHSGQRGNASSPRGGVGGSGRRADQRGQSVQAADDRHSGGRANFVVAVDQHRADARRARAGDVRVEVVADVPGGGRGDSGERQPAG